MVTWAEALGSVFGKAAAIGIKCLHDLTLMLVTPILTVVGLAFGWKVDQAHSPTFIYEPPADPSKPGPVEGAIGGAVKYAAGTLDDVAGIMVKGLADVGKTVGDTVAPIISGWTRGMIGELEKAMGAGSPDPELVEAVTKMLTATNDMIAKELEGAWKVPPGNPELTLAATNMIVNIIVAQTAAEGAGAAIDASHPVKHWQVREMASRIVQTLGYGTIVATLARMPLESSLFIGLRYHYMEQFTPMIPGPGDLISQYVREAHLSDRQVEFPGEFGSLMKKHGYVDQYSKLFWGAHWVLVPLDRLYDLYHRDLIKEDKLKLELKYHDYLPEWRDLLVKLSWALPGRIDSRWAYEFGMIDRDELKELAVKRGLDPEYANAVTDATIRNLFRTEITKLTTDAVTDYVDGWIDEAKLRANLGELEIPGDQVDYAVMDGKARTDRKRREDLRDIYITLFKNDEIVRAEFESRLIAIPMRKDAALLVVKEELTRKKLFEEAELIAVEEAK